MINLEDGDLEHCDHHKQYSDVAGKGVIQNSKNDAERVKLLSPWMSDSEFVKWTSMVFLASCVIGVSVDPLFLYVPIVNEDKKCLMMDEKMQNVAIVLRSVTDFTHLMHLIFRFRSAFKTAKEFNLSLYTGFPWPYILIAILSVIPVPQVIISVYFSKIVGSASLTTRKILNLFLLLQYLPRILRVYLSTMYLGKTIVHDLITHRDYDWVKGAFNLFLYVICGHVFGALWYFFSIYRETTCWHHACESSPGCFPRSFDCRGNIIPMSNLTFINEFCPVDPPNANIFDFGIFADAIQSRVLRSTNFLKKFSHCIWWGMRNLSSFGSNLETSSNIEDNFFAFLISILGLLLFIYLIGNLQTYLQVGAKNSEKIKLKMREIQPEIESHLSQSDLPKSTQRFIMRYIEHAIMEYGKVDVEHLISILEKHRQKSQLSDRVIDEHFEDWVTKILDITGDKKHKKDIKEQQAELWMKNYKIPDDLSSRVMKYVRLRMLEGTDVDVGNLLSIIPPILGKSVKEHLCIPILKKVPMLENMDEKVYHTICSYLKPVVYEEKSYIIRKGEPLDLMLFIMQGSMWSFGSSTSSVERLQRGDYYGIELLEWQLRSTSYSHFPVATCNVKSHTKVEAFTLSSIDLDNVIIKCLPTIANQGNNDLVAAIFARKLRRSPSSSIQVQFVMI